MDVGCEAEGNRSTARRFRDGSFATVVGNARPQGTDRAEYESRQRMTNLAVRASIPFPDGEVPLAWPRSSHRLRGYNHLGSGRDRDELRVGSCRRWYGI